MKGKFGVILHPQASELLTVLKGHTHEHEGLHYVLAKEVELDG